MKLIIVVIIDMEILQKFLASVKPLFLSNLSARQKSVTNELTTADQSNMIAMLNVSLPGRDARAVEGGGLENRSTQVPGVRIPLSPLSFQGLRGGHNVRAWRGGRAAEGNRLLSGYTPKAYRGFESLPLRCL